MVGARGFEPLTPSASRKCSPPELSARLEATAAASPIVPAEGRRASPHLTVHLTVPTSRQPGRPHRRPKPGRKAGFACGVPRETRVARPREPMVVYPLRADVAQLVEHNLAKVGVAGSNPVVRSTDASRVGCTGQVDGRDGRPSLIGERYCSHTRRRSQVARQRPAKPLSPVRIRASPPVDSRARSTNDGPDASPPDLTARDRIRYART